MPLFRALLCVALVAWSLSANIGHVQQGLGGTSAVETLVASHGHSHGIEDIAWARHGHAHDVIDHDHAPIALIRPPQERATFSVSLRWSWPTMRVASAWPEPLERPPRG